MLALLILNLEQGGKYTPFPRESYRSAAELILCGHSSGTWSFHAFFFLLFSYSSSSATSNSKKWSEYVRVGEVTGVWTSDQWISILCACVWACARMCVFLRVGRKHGPLPSTLHSFALCFGEGFISPAPTHSCVLTVKGERHQYSTPAALSALT